MERDSRNQVIFVDVHRGQGLGNRDKGLGVTEKVVQEHRTLAQTSWISSFTKLFSAKKAQKIISKALNPEPGKFFKCLLPTAYCLVTICFLLLAGCSAPQTKMERAIIPEEPLVWPVSTTDKPRIKYIREISRPEDVKVKDSFFEKLKKFLFGVSEERIAKPYGVTTDGSNRIVVADTASRAIHIFDVQKGKYFTVNDASSASLLSPIGVAVDGEGNIYVTDSELKKVLVYNKKGNFLFDVSQNLLRPTGIAINKSKKLIYVTDTWAHNIKVFNIKGDLVRTFGGRGNGHGDFNFPTNIFIDNQGLIYVTDSMNFRVQVFDKDERFYSKFGRHGDSSGDFSNPKGIAVDSEGHIFVVDANFDTVQIFDLKGRLLLNFGHSGQERGQFWLPSGIHIDEKDRIYVSDAYNSRVQVFQFLGGG